MEVIDKVGLDCSQDAVTELVQSVLDAEGAQGGMVVVFVDEPEIAELNGRYRGLDEPTDVLSFGSADDDAQWPDWPSQGLPVENGLVDGEIVPDLGEVIVCPAVVRRYAAEDGRDAGRQLGWTIIHGALHLLGYDHEGDEEGMRRREQALLKVLDNVVSAFSPSTKV
ncbi:MAG: rRNA maturation RNase YbeY [bacterium]